MTDVYDTYLDVATEKFHTVLDSIKSLDTKSFQSLASGTIVLGVGSSLGGFEAASTPALVFLALSAFAFTLLVLFTFKAVRVTLWSNRPDLKTLHDYLHDSTISYDALRLWTGQEYALSVEENQPFVVKKAEYTFAAIFALAAEVILLLVGVVLV